MIDIDNNIDFFKSKDAKSLDKVFCTMIYRFKDVPRKFKHVIEFKCKKFENWEIFANNNDGGVYVDGNEIFAVFLNKEVPFFRFYFFSKNDLMSFENILNKYNVFNFKDSQLLKTILDPALLDKSEQWFKVKEELFKNSTIVAQGRNENTTIEQSIILQREPFGCFVCGNKSTGYVSTIISTEGTKFIIADTCEAHKEECKKYKCVLDYIFKKLGSSIKLPSMTKEIKIDNSILEYIYREIEKELDVTELKNQRKHTIKNGEDEFTATFQRDSGFMIYIRLTSLMDYAYIINNPDKTQFKRIDTENHHNDILDFGPDHIHNKPKDNTKIQKKEKTIQSSFTTGFPLWDLPAIKKMLEDAEREWALHQI